MPALHHRTLPQGLQCSSFLVMADFILSDQNILPEKELHWSLWVQSPSQRARKRCKHTLFEMFGHCKRSICQAPASKKSHIKDRAVAKSAHSATFATTSAQIDACLSQLIQALSLPGHSAKPQHIHALPNSCRMLAWVSGARGTGWQVALPASCRRIHCHVRSN